MAKKLKTCKECGEFIRTDGYCSEPTCVNANGDDYDVQMIRFEQSLKEEDFALGDSFWIGRFEFEVVGWKC